MESELQMIAAKREKLGQNLGVLFGCSAWLVGWLRGLEICPVVFVSCLPSVRSHVVARYFDLRRICESSFCLLFLRSKSLQRFQRFDEFEFSCSTVCCGVCALAIR